MPIGPGKYDELCTHVREKAKAQGAIVIVFGGELGSGFSVQADPLTLKHLPSLLREVAGEMERSSVLFEDERAAEALLREKGLRPK
jgi:hypothetical protein